MANRSPAWLSEPWLQLPLETPRNPRIRASIAAMGRRPMRDYAPQLTGTAKTAAKVKL
jgi:hypothetical protein